MRLLLLFVFLGLAAGFSAAEEIATVDMSGDYFMKLKGPIERGDADNLAEAVRQKGKLPLGIQLESTGGNIDEAMAIGRLIRKSMLSTTAGKQCDGACFLVWIAGIKRSAMGTMNIALGSEAADKKETVRSYLLEMEVPEELAAKALDPSADKVETVFPAERMGEWVREYSPAYRQWLAEKCGGLTAEEADDWRAIRALEIMEAPLSSMGMDGGNSMYNVDAETQRQAARAREFTPEYAKALAGKRKTVRDCQVKAIENARTAVLRFW